VDERKARLFSMLQTLLNVLVNALPEILKNLR